MMPCKPMGKNISRICHLKFFCHSRFANGSSGGNQGAPTLFLVNFGGGLNGEMIVVIIVLWNGHGFF